MNGNSKTAKTLDRINNVSQLWRNVILAVMSTGLVLFFLADFFRVPGRVDTLEEKQTSMAIDIQEIREDVKKINERFHRWDCWNRYENNPSELRSCEDSFEDE